MAYLTSSYDPWVVVASILVASFASYVTLDLAKRVRTKDRGVALSWWIGGFVPTRTGMWGQRFGGIRAFSFPIALGAPKILTCLPSIGAVAGRAMSRAVVTL